MPAAQPEADVFCGGQVPAANANIPDRTHESGAALTAVPLFFSSATPQSPDASTIAWPMIYAAATIATSRVSSTAPVAAAIGL